MTLADVLRLDLNRLLVLHVLLELHSVKAAAHELGLTQSAVSHTLRKLRAELDDPLLVRRSNSLELTERARAIAPALGEAVAALRRAVSPPDVFVPGAATGVFVMSCADYGASVLLPELLARLGTDAPGLRLELRAPTFENDIELARGDLDLAVVLHRNIPASYHCRLLLEDEFVCLMAADNPAARRHELDLETYASLRHVVVAPYGRPGTLIDAPLVSGGVERRVAARVPSFLLALEVVRRTALVLTAPRRLAVTGLRTELVLRSVPVELPRIRLASMWHARSHDDPGHEFVRKHLAAVARCV